MRTSADGKASSSCAQRGVDGHPHFRFAALVEIAEHVRTAMRHHRLAESAGAHVLAVDDQRYFDLAGGHPRQRRLEVRALR